MYKGAYEKASDIELVTPQDDDPFIDPAVKSFEWVSKCLDTELGGHYENERGKVLTYVRCSTTEMAKTEEPQRKKRKRESGPASSSKADAKPKRQKKEQQTQPGQQPEQSHEESAPPIMEQDRAPEQQPQQDQQEAGTTAQVATLVVPNPAAGDQAAQGSSGATQSSAICSGDSIRGDNNNNLTRTQLKQQFKEIYNSCGGFTSKPAFMEPLAIALDGALRQKIKPHWSDVVKVAKIVGLASDFVRTYAMPLWPMIKRDDEVRVERMRLPLLAMTTFMRQQSKALYDETQVVKHKPLQIHLDEVL